MVRGHVLDAYLRVSKTFKWGTPAIQYDRYWLTRSTQQGHTIPGGNLLTFSFARDFPIAKRVSVTQFAKAIYSHGSVGLLGFENGWIGLYQPGLTLAHSDNLTFFVRGDFGGGLNVGDKPAFQELAVGFNFVF
ncbi:MAG: hypothetical protein COV31_00820 [Candidatus Yanofskybacteria bacterium CG10_big_fil_rev_8_21_14_0_10_46_23]|uniref:Uncharacterized protein n=1 Tax=Candidatus Yanofskybacteria bacterium CG10_big_fil_rev_8_21_14_0_10_46_23 TaxID=1975098 RepID=A0A2H0R4F1_9BACT|nr:MAG: hypothetical protein COV31_00820 [Candidatus Yanofskybacteria bacterium CG10_big_fil_rev_8_21_14_0_10_46_23]